MNWQNILNGVLQKNFLQIARCISLVENEVGGYYEFLKKLPQTQTPVIGITGPPGAGKSTLVDALIEQIILQNKSVAVLCIDPSSPFNLGALLGDRVRMSNWYNHELVYIRSLASRGSLGGLHPKIIEITDILKAAQFDYIIIETVGVGQSEIEIAGLADATVVVMVPEAGDEIQTLKSGIMEIANIFVVNKADRDGADKFVYNLQQMLTTVNNNESWQIPIIKTIANNQFGIMELFQKIESYLKGNFENDKKNWLLTQKAFLLIQNEKMKYLNKTDLFKNINIESKKSLFNLYEFVEKYF